MAMHLIRREGNEGLADTKPAPWPELTPENMAMLGIGVALGVAGVLVTALFAKLLSGDSES